MLNNRDDDNKFEGHDESEYHFSDEDVSYEVEPEASKKSSPAEKAGGAATRLIRSKRTWIVGAVFLGLVFLVYKMLAPSSTPSLEIAAVPASSEPATVVTTTVTATTNNPATTNTPPVQSLPAVPVPATVSAPSSVASLPPSGAAVEKGLTTNTAVANQTQTAPAPVAQPAVSAPAVIPVNSATPSATQATTNAPVTQTTGTTFVVPGAETAEANAKNIAADRERLLAQLQADYTQKVDDFSTQNKALQEQVQTLNARVAGLEAQLNQVLQALSRQNQSMSSNINNPGAAAPVSAPAQSVAPKIAFNVQAIIPGRAWLKSDNGDTMTVAEGDVIKDVGRVTKVDPYDGVVEINTGNRVVSLSYGNPS